MAMMAAYVASWLCVVATEAPERRTSLLSFALVGALGALTHLYAALFCCCLAAGLMVLSVLDRRPKLLREGLVLALSSVLFSIAWLVFGLSAVSKLNWIELSPGSLATAIWEIKQLVFGSRLMLGIFAIMFLLSLLNRATRGLGILFGSTAGLFCVIPLVISLEHPIITGRYWLIGAPMITVFAAFFARSSLSHIGSEDRWRLHLVSGIGALIFLLVTDIGGVTQARAFTANKPIWSGAAIVAPLLDLCPAGSVRVNGSPANFAFAAQAPEAVFVPRDAFFPEPAAHADETCPVLGWAEHVREGNDFLRVASDEELLQYLNIRASASEVDIRRHSSGFVVLRRSSTSNMAPRRLP
jgi:hypothetical protein